MLKDPAAEAELTDLADRLRIGLARAARRLRKETDGEQPVSAISALSVLSKRGPMTLSALAEAEGVSRPSMTVLANSLLDQKLVAKTADPDDGRLVLVRVTAEGKRVLDNSRTLRNAFLTRWLSRLDQEDRLVLERAAAILARLADPTP